MSELLAELDDALAALLGRELGVTVGFEAPACGFSAERPGIGLYLYAVEEAAALRSRQWTIRRDGEQAWRASAPLPLAATYAVTAWADDVRAEHALLSAALAVVRVHPVLPADVLAGSLADTSVTMSAPFSADGVPARDLWSALGGPSKLAVALRATAALDVGPRAERGPPAREAHVRISQRDT